MTQDAEQFIEAFQVRLVETAQRAAAAVGAEATLLALAGATANFGLARGMSAADVASTLHRFAELLEQDADAISASRTAH